MGKNNNEKEIEVVKTSSDNKIIIILLLLIIIIMFVFILLLVTNRVIMPINTQPTNDNPISNNEEQYQNTDNNTNKPENIYKIEYKEETKEFKNSSGKVIIKNKRNYPIITNEANPNAASNIAKTLKDISDKSWDSLNTGDQVTDKNFIENYPYEVGVTYTYTTEQSNIKYLSFKDMTSGGMGGVSWANTNGYNFDFETGKLLEVNDIMDYNSHKDELYEYITSEIEKEHNPETLWNDNVSGYWKDTVKKEMFKTNTWLFTSSGIKVYFSKYSLGPGSTGVVEVEIPTSKINNYLYDKYKYQKSTTQ